MYFIMIRKSEMYLNMKLKLEIYFKLKSNKLKFILQSLENLKLI